MNLGKSLNGMLTVKITSAIPEKALDSLAQARIPLSHVAQQTELSYEIQIYRRDYSRLYRILKHRGDRVEIIQKKGIYWTLEALCHRPILLTTAILMLLTSFFLPTRIFFVTVEGNTTIPDRKILTAAEDCGIHFGASRKLVRSEKMKNALLSAVPQLQWAGINTAGCTAVISIRERTEEETPKDTNPVSNLIADRDGFILSTTIIRGTPLIRPGDTVIKGQLLVSGYSDYGIYIRTSRAAGEILAQTNRKISAVMPKIFAVPYADPEINYKISIIIGKKRINLWKDSRISDTGCGRMYEEYFVSLPGSFQLPIAICVDRYHNYEFQESEIPETDAQTQLQSFSDVYLHRQMIAGQILRKKQLLTSSDGLFEMESDYICTEMIGKEQREQIGVINGKRN